MLQRIFEKTLTTGTVAQATYTTAIDMNNVSTLSVQAVSDVNTASGGAFASTDVSTSNDTIAIATPTFVAGEKGQFTTSGTLPTGISASTDYFVIVVSTGVYAFATSLANAQAGTKVNITAAGAGNSTFTPTSIAGGTLSFQFTNISNSQGNTASTTATDWFDYQTATSIAADGTTTFRLIGPAYRWFRIKTDLTAGSLSNTYYVLTMGEMNQ